MNSQGSASNNPLIKHLLNKIIEIEYLFHNPDVERLKLDAVIHFENNGTFENRRLSCLFDNNYVQNKLNIQDMENECHIFFTYFNKNVDFLPTGILDIDYIKSVNPNYRYFSPQDIFYAIYNNDIKNIHPFFDYDLYCGQLADLGITISTHPLIHYLNHGWRDGLRPHAFFDDWYLREMDNINDDECSFMRMMSSEKIYEFHPSPLIDMKHFNHFVRKISRSQQNIISFFGENIDNIPFSSLNKFYRSPVVNYILDNGKSFPFELKQLSTIGDFIKLHQSIKGIPLNDDEVEITFIVINYKLLPLTLLSLMSIINSANGINFEIILINNESDSLDDEIFYRYLENINNITIISSRKNLSFGEANNIAIDRSKGQYICFLNNDAFLTRASLESMLNLIKSDESIGAVGPIFFNDKMLIVEAGANISSDGLPQMVGRGQTLNRIFHEKIRPALPRETDYISAACLIVKKKILMRIGGFDYIYEPAYYEDTDLCFRIKLAGYRLVLDINAYCLHQCNTTANEFLGEKVQSIVSLLRDKFISRWFSGESYANLEIPDNEAKTGGISIGIFTPFAISIGGGENYILSVASALSLLGDITLITPGLTSRSRVNFVLRDLGIEPFPFNITDLDKARKVSFDYAFIMGNQPISDNLISAKKIIYMCQFPFPLSHSPVSYNIEKAKLIDTFIVNSEFTGGHLSRALKKYKIPNSDIKVIYPPIRAANLDKDSLMKNKTSNLYPIFTTIGRFCPVGHAKNHHIILKALEAAEDEYTLGGYICGGLSCREADINYFNTLRNSHLSPNILFLPNISSSKLNKIYTATNFYIHGAGLNTISSIHPYNCEHFGMTIVEAILHGCIPLVPDVGGPAEIINDLKIGFVYHSYNDLINTIMKLCDLFYNDFEQYCKLLSRCLNVDNKYSFSNFSEKIRKLISGV